MYIIDVFKCLIHPDVAWYHWQNCYWWCAIFGKFSVDKSIGLDSLYQEYSEQIYLITDSIRNLKYRILQR